MATTRWWNPRLLGWLAAGVAAAVADPVFLDSSATPSPQFEVVTSVAPAMSPASLQIRTCQRSASAVLVLDIPGRNERSMQLSVTGGTAKLVWTAPGATAQSHLPNYNVFVHDCAWHRVIVDWSSTTVTLTVDNLSVSSRLGFESDFTRSVLVGSTSRTPASGGYPVVVPELAASYLPFSGCIDSLTLGRASVSSIVATSVGAGCPELLFPAFVPIVNETAMTFGRAAGIASFAQFYRSNIASSSLSDELVLNVRTRATAGVLFFTGRGSQYIMLELLRGQPLLSFKFDAGTQGSVSAGLSVNDGQWHSISVTRSPSLEFNLTLNERTPGPLQTVVQRAAAGATNVFRIPDDIFVGGISPDYDISTTILTAPPALVGCVQGVRFNGLPLDHQDMLAASQGVLAQGCSSATGVCDNDPCADYEVCVDDFDQHACRCPEGFSGDACATNIDDCVDDPCANGAVCRDRIANYTCECAAGWMGRHCTIVDLCAPLPCGQGGQCSTPLEGGSYACACYPGFYGTNCSMQCDQGQCDSNAVVSCAQADGRQRTCVACNPGFYGEGCDNACQSIPTCAGTVSCRKTDGSQPSCVGCVRGFYGTDCSTQCDVGYCSSLGSIISCNQFNGGEVRCTSCTPGYFGQGDGPGQNDCSLACPLNNCTQVAACDRVTGVAVECSGCQPGMHGQTCSAECRQGNCVGTVICDQENGGNRQCTQCAPGFFGVDCERVCTRSNCNITAGVASCDQLTGQATRCSTCVGGFWGDGDELLSDEEELNHDVGSAESGFGGEMNDCARTCTSETCVSVTNCQKASGVERICEGCTDDVRWGPACTELCNQGHCVGDVRCDQSGTERRCVQCIDRWYGTDCTDACQPNPGCIQDSTATYRCDFSTGELQECSTCIDGQYGLTCDLDCFQGQCEGVVTCAQATGMNRVCSACQNGYYGVNCSSRCNIGNCNADSIRCDKADGSNRSCTSCVPGWQGTACEIEIDECSPDPCNGHGECTDAIANFTCECEHGWVGRDCSIRYEIQSSFSFTNTSLLHFDSNAMAIAALPSDWSSVSIEFTAPPALASGVIMYATGFGIADFSIELIQGTLKVVEKSSLGEVRRTLLGLSAGTDSFNDGRWHSINVSFSTGTISVDNAWTERVRFNRPIISVSSGFSLAGPSQQWDNGLINRLESGRHFGGCIRNVRINVDYTVNMVLANQRLGTTYGCPRITSACSLDSCGEHGVCVDGWDSYSCRCDFGWEGAACATRVPTWTLSGQTAALATVHTLGLSAVQNGLDFRRPVSMEMAFRTRVASATLIYVSSATARDSLALHINDGRLHVDLTSSQADEVANAFSANSSVAIDDGVWHTIDMRVNDESVLSLFLDGIQFSRETISWLPQLRIWDGVLTIGAIESSLGSYSNFFTGCVRSVRINRIGIPVSGSTSIALIEHIGPTPVSNCIGANMCTNGTEACPSNTSSCNDLWNLAYCDCHPGYGPPGVCTSNIDDCRPDSCNTGHCVDGLNNFSCVCDGTGFTGARCEVNIDDCTPNPCANDGICRDEVLGYTCDCPVQYTGTTCTLNVNECVRNPCAVGEFCTELATNCDVDGVNCSSAAFMRNWVGYTCTAWTRCNASAYQTIAGTSSTDRVCSPLTRCDPRVEYASVSPTATTDRICSQLSPSCGGVNNTYELISQTSSTDRVCANCSACQNLEYIFSACNPMENTLCRACTVCNATSQYEAVPCLAAADTVCAEVTTCNATSFFTTDFTTTTDRVCAPLSECNSSTEFESISSTVSSDRACSPLSPTCVSGETFESSAPTSTSDRVCTRCNSCLFGEYMVMPCNTSHDVQCQSCTGACLNGGTCFANAAGPGFRCECLPEFSDSRCGTVDPCLQYTLNHFRQHGSHQPPCLNSGSCSAQNNSWVCTCSNPAHLGPRCGTVLCADDSRRSCNAVSCNVSQSGNLSCSCAPGWEGSDCTIREFACTSEPCGAHGICDGISSSSYICSCDSGWGGQLCDTPPRDIAAGGANAAEGSDDTDTATIGLAVGVACALMLVVGAFAIYRRRLHSKGQFSISNDFKHRTKHNDIEMSNVQSTPMSAQAATSRENMWAGLSKTESNAAFDATLRNPSPSKGWAVLRQKHEQHKIVRQESMTNDALAQQIGSLVDAVRALQGQSPNARADHGDSIGDSSA